MTTEFWSSNGGAVLYRRVSFTYSGARRAAVVVRTDLKKNISESEVYTVDAHGAESFAGYINCHTERTVAHALKFGALRKAAVAAYEARP